MVLEVKEYIDEGLVNIIGGCCGIMEEYIVKYQELIVFGFVWVFFYIFVIIFERLWFFGLELLEQIFEMNFINVGEWCNVVGFCKFFCLINEKKYEEVLSIVCKQVEDGVLVIDVNMDDGLLDVWEEMIIFLNLVMFEFDIVCVFVMIDFFKWEVIEVGLKCL